MAVQVLFLCTANSARSILAEATLNHLGGDRFRACSAGSQAAGRVNPAALAQLERAGISTSALRSKGWEEFERPDAPAFDVVVTVCDSAAQEPCPVFFGDFVRTHWGLPDPAAVRGSEQGVADAFARTHDVIRRRLEALIALPVENFRRDELAAALKDLAERIPADSAEVVAIPLGDISLRTCESSDESRHQRLRPHGSSHPSRWLEQSCAAVRAHQRSGR